MIRYVSRNILMLIVLSLTHALCGCGSPNDGTPAAPAPSSVSPVTGAASDGSTEAALDEGLTAALNGILALPLETRENVDFLLTPGLLIQQHLKGTSVITYSGE